MRQCPCGGGITQHQLTGDREAWSCKQFGRYEAIPAKTSQPQVNDPAPDPVTAYYTDRNRGGWVKPH